MSERHSFDFDKFGFNVVSDAEKGAILLQFDEFGRSGELIDGLLQAFRKRFSDDFWSRLRRRRLGAENPFLLPDSDRRHPEHPKVRRFEFVVRQGEKFEPALATLFEFLRSQPGYRRMYGSRLDPDDAPSRSRRPSTEHAANAAREVLEGMLARYHQN